MTMTMIVFSLTIGLILGGIILLPALLARRKMGDQALVKRLQRSENEVQSRYIWFS